MTYFIEAARQLMSSEGIQALSIRGIAEIAGYNSATSTTISRICSI